MSRTPLFDRLRHAAALVRESERRGLDVEQTLESLHDSAPERALSRRRFLAVAAATGALAACDRAERVAGPLVPRLAKGGGPQPRIAIVGAGLAGLTCAFRLRQAGLSATVYEASTRLGGRCWTLRGGFADGQIAEHGGELIDQSHTEIRQLAQELGLPLDNLLRAEANGATPLYWVGGSRYTYAEATRDMKAVWQPLHRDLSAAPFPTTWDSFTARGQQLDQMSLGQWIAQNVPGGRLSRLGRVLEAAYVIEYGADIDDQSALNLIYLMGFSGQGQLRVFGPSNEKYHVRDGNDQIVQRLAASLGSAQIVTDSPLLAIARTSAGAYTLTFANGAGTRVVTADHVVLALPFSVMRASVDYSAAGFDQRKLQTIAQLGMGANAKLNVQFSSRRWEALGCTGETYSDAGWQSSWEVSRGQPGTSGILVDYSGGSATLAQGGQSAASLAQQFVSAIDALLPGMAAAYTGTATLDWWPGDPWTRGAYSYWKVGQYTTIAGAEGMRSFDCHFAGEHTSIESQGYLNGAVESGERVATEILADVKA